MGGSNYSSSTYTAKIDNLHSTGTAFATSAKASITGDYHNIPEILDPRKLKNGIRESCYTNTHTDVVPVIISIDGTGSMGSVPREIQKLLPKLMEILIEQGVSSHPNIMFMMHDDEMAMPPDAVFQMSQFETGAEELVTALNEMIIPGCGGGNDGEAYHISFYAAANHTRLDCFDKDGNKGYFIMICDEQPYYDNKDTSKHGMLPSVAKEVFGDIIEKEIPMVESVRKTAEKYHIIIIRPGHTAHGKNKKITKAWQTLLSNAGENPEHVLEIEDTEDIIPTIATAIGRLVGHNDDELVDILKAKGFNPNNIIKSTNALTPIETNTSTGIVSKPIETTNSVGVNRR